MIKEGGGALAEVSTHATGAVDKNDSSTEEVQTKNL
jgi:hypothetical protein